MLLGLDLGTTNVKALVTDFAGRRVASGSCPVQLMFAGLEGVEQDIEEIWSASLSAIKQAVQSIDASAVKAVGVSSQGGALQITDRQHRPAGRVISWLDRRGKSFDAALTAELGEEWFIERIGHNRSGLAVGQLMRLRSELAEGAKLAGFVGDHIVRRLCGQAGHDGTSCSLTALYDPLKRDYAVEILRRIGIGREQLPRLCSPREPVGGLLPEIARATGLRAGIPVSPAVHDQYAAALATGAVRAGTVMVGTGTAWVLLAVTDFKSRPVSNAAFSCHHVAEQLWGQIVSLINGGSALAWALDLTGNGKKTNQDIDAILSSAPAGCDGARCWPFLAPGNITGVAAQTHGRLSGLKLSHGAPHILRAVVEGLACELGRHLSFLRAAKIPVERLVLGGPGAGSDVTPQIIAGVTGLPVSGVAAEGGSPLGAAIIARGLCEPGTPLAVLSGQMAPGFRYVEADSNARLYHQLFEEYLRFLPLKNL